MVNNQEQTTDKQYVKIKNQKLVKKNPGGGPAVWWANKIYIDGILYHRSGTTYKIYYLICVKKNQKCQNGWTKVCVVKFCECDCFSR